MPFPPSHKYPLPDLSPNPPSPTPMKQNRAFRAPSVAKQNTSKQQLKRKKIFGVQASNNPGRIHINAEQESEYAKTLQQSEAYINSVDNHITKALKLVATFNAFVASVKRIEQAAQKKREVNKAQQAALGNDSIWQESLHTRPEKQENHAKLCAMLLAHYRQRLDEMFASGEMKKIWEVPGSQTHLFAKSIRNTVSYRPNQEGRGEPSLDFGVFTDIAEELRRNIARWETINLPGFDMSGPRLAPLVLSAAADVDTAGMQINQMKKWWGHRGVKFNDIDRDTMAFAKAVAPQGAQVYYNKKSTLDQIHEYRFPFKCTGNRFGNDDLTTEQIIMLGDGGGGATSAAVRRRKGTINTRGSGSGGALPTGDRYCPPTALGLHTLGVKTSDPLEENDLGLPTDYLRRLKPFERFGTMKSSALKERLKGPSPSFLSKVKRDELPVYLRKEIYPNVKLGIDPESTFKKDSRQLFGKGPSGRERPGLPFVRMSAKKESRMSVPETMEEYKRMKQGMPMKRKKYIMKGDREKLGGSSQGSDRQGSGGRPNRRRGGQKNSHSMGSITGGTMTEQNSAIFEGGSALLPSQSASLIRSSKNGAPSIPSRVPGDSQVLNPATEDDESTNNNNSMMYGDDEDDDGGEDDMYAAMIAEANVDAHLSFEESTVVDVGALVEQMDQQKSSSRTATMNSSSSTTSAQQTKKKRRTRRRPVGMQITVRSPAGAYVSLRVTPKTTINEIRDLMQTKTGLSSKIREQLQSCAVIVFKKHIVQPNSTLADIGAGNNSTLQALQYW